MSGRIAEPILSRKPRTVPSSAHSAVALKLLLEECGYTGTRLKEGYVFGSMSVPLVGFATKPWDFDSACIAVMVGNGDSEATAKSCRGMGAPIVWVRRNGTVDWWMQHDQKPTLFASKPVTEFAAFVREHKDRLDPVSVYRGKTIARVDTSRQLDFVDAGLLPLLREEAGKKLHDLVEAMTKVTLKKLGESDPSPKILQRVFTAVFRMLAGKILRDKGVEKFKTLKLVDPGVVLAAVSKHYAPNQTTPILTGRWQTALTAAIALIRDAGNFGVVSPETLAYVYEHTLVTKALRKKLGIHATPPWLVDYMVWKLYDWIREIPEADRHVFEPACGHAPFLLSTMRLLRLEMQDRDEAEVHDYLKSHIHGVEIDDFAREIARLSLTLADIPNPNGWDLQEGDMYASDVLKREATKCRILLSNPPYEKFDDDEKKKCHDAGFPVAHKKAVELLHRTLGRLRPGSVFAVVVPQTVVSGPEAKAIRTELLREFEIAEVCLFPGKVFEFAEAETAIILGRRCKVGQHVGTHRVRLRAVGEHGMVAFQDTYDVTSRAEATQSRLGENAGHELWVPALDEVWRSMKDNQRVRDVATVGRGIEYKSDEARGKVPVVVDIPAPKKGYPAGYASVAPRKQAIFTTPPESGIAVGPELIENSRQGMPDGIAKVLVNRTRTARSRWRMKALLDPDGKPVKNNFLTVRPNSPKTPALFLWAVLNSPVANAFFASDTMKRDNADGALADIPLPRIDAESVQTIVKLAEAYRAMAQQRAAMITKPRAASRHQRLLYEEPEVVPAGPADADVRQALLALDAAVLRLYDLPPRLERQLLDYFAGHERRGVGCDFQGYYPRGFTSYMPLYMVISDSFQRAAADATADRFKPGESAYVRDMLSAAAAASAGEE